jgi:hypothetical protein
MLEFCGEHNVVSDVEVGRGGGLPVPSAASILSMPPSIPGAEGSVPHTCHYSLPGSLLLVLPVRKCTACGC